MTPRVVKFLKKFSQFLEVVNLAENSEYVFHGVVVCRGLVSSDRLIPSNSTGKTLTPHTLETREFFSFFSTNRGLTIHQKPPTLKVWAGTTLPPSAEQNQTPLSLPHLQCDKKTKRCQDYFFQQKTRSLPTPSVQFEIQKMSRKFENFFCLNNVPKLFKQT